MTIFLFYKEFIGENTGWHGVQRQRINTDRMHLFHPHNDAEITQRYRFPRHVVSRCDLEQHRSIFLQVSIDEFHAIFLNEFQSRWQTVPNANQHVYILQYQNSVSKIKDDFCKIAGFQNVCGNVDGPCISAEAVNVMNASLTIVSSILNVKKLYVRLGI